MNELVNNINSLMKGESSIPFEVQLETKSILLLTGALIAVVVSIFVCKKFL